MKYSFHDLFHADFEDLARDLIGKELGVRFEAFAAGPDGGIDGRHAMGVRKTILQAKHYAGPKFSVLKSAIKRERSKIELLKPNRYLLATTLRFNPPAKAELVKLLKPWVKQASDVYSADDLNGP